MDKKAGSCSKPTREPQFTQIISSRILQDGILEIPRHFLKEHRSRLPNNNNLHLAISTRKMWKVELKRSRGRHSRVWLSKGWQEFVEKCSIRGGYTLMFRYEDDFVFHVLVFDQKYMKIECPLSSSTTKTMLHLEDSDDDCSVEILDTWPPNNTKMSSKEARDIQSPNPYFTVNMKPSYHAYLYVPKAGRSFFCGRTDDSVCLNGPDGRSWSLSYCISRLGIVLITVGWREFIQEYHLQDGDRCNFELTDCMVMTLNVVIFRASEQEFEKNVAVQMPETPIPIHTGKREISGSTALERAKSLKCNNSSFTVLIKFNLQSLYYLFQLRIPADHALQYLSDHHEKEVFLKGIAEKSWAVTCSVHSSVVRFSSGWKDFVLDNELQDGDACVFELISQEPHHYNVTIFRAAESAQQN